MLQNPIETLQNLYDLSDPKVFWAAIATSVAVITALDKFVVGPIRWLLSQLSKPKNQFVIQRKNLDRELRIRTATYVNELHTIIEEKNPVITQIYYRFFERLYSNPTDNYFFYLSRPSGNSELEKRSMESLLLEYQDIESETDVLRSIHGAIGFISKARKHIFDDQVEPTVLDEFKNAFQHWLTDNTPDSESP
jgi:hypothetical protein